MQLIFFLFFFESNKLAIVFYFALVFLYRFFFCFFLFASETWKEETLLKFDQIVSPLSLQYTNSEDNSIQQLSFSLLHHRQSLIEALDEKLWRMRESQKINFWKHAEDLASRQFNDIYVYLRARGKLILY